MTLFNFSKQCVTVLLQNRTQKSKVLEITQVFLTNKGIVV